MKKLFVLFMAVVMVFSVIAMPVANAAVIFANDVLDNAAVRDAQTLDEALNVEGGTLSFFCMGQYQWQVERDHAKAGNSGIPGTSCNLNTSIEMTAGQRLSFRYKTSCNPNDSSLSFLVNHNMIEYWAGENDWATYEWTAPEDGSYFIAWTYYRGPGEAMYDDNAYMDDICILAPAEETPTPGETPTPEPTPEVTPEPASPVTGVEMQERATVYPDCTLQLNYSVLPENAENKSVSFTSSDASVATVDENGVVTGVAVGTATIVVTTADGGFTAECLVTVEELESIDIYGYNLYASDGDSKQWISFKNTNPRNSTIYSEIVTGDTYGATMAGSIVYGFCNGNGSSTYGPYFKINFDNMSVAFPGSDSDKYVVLGMAYDYSAQKMYALCTITSSEYIICEVDRASGTMRKVCDIPVQTYEGWESDTIWTFAISRDGTPYCIMSHVAVVDNAYVGRNGILYTIDFETGALTEVGDTGIPTYFIQSMAFDVDNDRLYWANMSNDAGGTLYTVDVENANAVRIGSIATERGCELMSMSIPSSIEVTDPNEPCVEVSFVDDVTGDVLKSMTVKPGYELSEYDYPTVPEHEGYMFAGWDYLSDKRVYFDTEIHTHHCDAANPIWSFETQYQAEQWIPVDSDNDGMTWFWSEFRPSEGYLYAYDGERCMASESYSNTLQMPLTPDNWLISPEIVLHDAIENPKLSFYIRAQAPGYEDEHLGIYISTDNGATWLDELDCLQTTAEYTRYEIDLSEFAGQTIVIGFRHYDSTGQFMINLDCVQIEACDVNYNPPTPKPTPTPEPTPEPIDGEKLFGWSFESESEVSEWTILDSDNDGKTWGWTGNFADPGSWKAQDGLYCMYSASYDNSQGQLYPDNWLISPDFTVPSDVERAVLSFWYIGQDASYCADTVTVYISGDGGNTWEETITVVGGKEQQRATVDLSDYIGASVKVAFRHYNCTNFYAINIDNVEIYSIADPVNTPTPEPGETEEPVVTPEPGETDEPVVTPEPGETDEPVVTPEPGETDEPVVTPEPTTPPVPPTGAISLIGLGAMAVITGAGTVFFRRKEK